MDGSKGGGGLSSLGAQCNIFSMMRSLERSFCCSFWSRLFSVITWLLLYVEVQFCSFQRRVLKNFCPTFCFTIAEVVSRTILYHCKRLIESVPIGEGPGDVAQWRGWNLLSTSVCDALILCFFISVYQLFSIYFQSLIFVNAVPLINLLITFFYNKILMHTSWGPTDHIMVSELVDCLCKFVNA